MDDSIEDNLGEKSKEVHQTLKEHRKHEIQAKVFELKSRLPQLGRCIICTLRIPCKHFKSINELSNITEADAKLSQTTSVFDITDYLPKLIPESHKRGFSVRYRGHNTIYNFDQDRKNTTLPNEKRLRQLEIIENYREEKIKKEIDKLQLVKQEEEKKKQEQNAVDNLRKKYLIKQKEKLNEYKESFAVRMEMFKDIIDSQNGKKQKDEEKRKKYLEKQKIKLNEYHAQQEILKKISRQKILELEDTVINYKPIKIKHML